MGKICLHCGQDTKSIYSLCYNCLQLKGENKIVKCQDCGKWHDIDKECTCKNTDEKIENKIESKEANDIKNETETSELTKSNYELTCIICGKDSTGKHFCKDCYYKYKDREIDIHIKHCAEFSISDEYGNLKYKCQDGRKVRSRAEVIISDFLFSNKVRAIYEKDVFYEENGENKCLHPDFYLPDYNIYLEYNELTNKNYLESKKYTQKIYDQLNFKVIIMNDDDLTDIAAFLKPKLGMH